MTKEPIIKIMETAEKLEAAQKKIEELKKKYTGGEPNGSK